MRALHIDVETYSAANLTKAGAYRYAADPAFAVLMAAYVFGDDPLVGVWSYDLGPMPTELTEALLDPGVVKYAHNAAFELATLSAHLGRELDPAQWRCTMVHAASLGLPRSLDKLAKHLGVSDKDQEGKRLINLYSKPISTGGRKGERRLPADYPDDWQRFRDYCVADVVAEREIADVLAARPMPESEWQLWAVDQRINARGIRVSRELAANAVEIDALQVASRHRQMQTLTGLANPNSLAQLSPWLAEHGSPLPDLLRPTVEAAASDLGTPKLVRDVLTLRLANASKSTAKYAAMLNVAGSDDRARGLFQFYGADTGRWAGRLVQVQNLPRPSVSAPELDALRGRLRKCDYSLTSDDLKNLIRTALIPSDGHVLIAADYSAIEARVLAWLASESWALAAFRDHGMIYEATAAQMLGKPLSEVTKEDRHRGKVATLALGYQGGTAALERMGAATMGLTTEELPALVAQWRRANRKIVRLWQAFETAARDASGKARTVARCQFARSRAGTLYVTLPSGRALAYPGWRVSDLGRLSYVNHAKSHREDTYGGKLTENIVQAVARDVLADALVSLDMLGYQIVGHVHDEVIIEAPPSARVGDVVAVMTTLPRWAAGLPLAAEGSASAYYAK